MEHIIIKEEEKFNVLQAEDGYYITNYVITEPVTEYYGSTLMYMPKSVDYTIYYAITAEQHQIYEDEKQRYIDEMENNNDENAE